MGKSKPDGKCYRCGSPAVSNEHVPPRCLFPEQKDIPDADFRKNLITVPSCDVHNSQKSTDDEFLMASMSGILNNNIVGFIHTKTKVRRAFERNRLPFADLIMTKSREILFKTNKGALFPLIVGSPNVPRLTKCFENIAYGLYLYEYKERFEGECVVMLGFVNYQDTELEKIKRFGARSFDAHLNSFPLKGDNPAIFQYQFDESEPHIVSLRLVFYGNAEVYISLKGKGAPFNLLHALARISESTTFTLDNGEQVVLRK